jgi:hypothetical protein
MNTQWLEIFLNSLPDVFLYLLIFVLSFIVEIFYTFWILRTSDRLAKQAANWSTLLYIFSMVGFTGVLSVNNFLIIPSAFGVWLGSYYTIKYDSEKKS